MFFYRNGHLPYGTADGPAGFIVNLENYESFAEGYGTTYPLAMTLDEYCACFYRVKSWRLQGSVSIENGEEGQNYWEGSHEIDMVFDRFTAHEELLITRGKVVFSTNSSRRNELFGSLPVAEPFSGTHFIVSGTPQQVAANFEITVNFSPQLDQESGILSVGDSQVYEDNLAVSFRLLFSVSGTATRSIVPGPGESVSSFSTEASTIGFGLWPVNEPLGNPEVGALEISGPFESPKSVELFALPDAGISFENLTLEPAEWFTYDIYGSGPLYDSETGDFL